MNGVSEVPTTNPISQETLGFKLHLSFEVCENRQAYTP